MKDITKLFMGKKIPLKYSKLIDFNVIMCKKFLDMISESTL